MPEVSGIAFRRPSQQARPASPPSEPRRWSLASEPASGVRLR